MLTEQEIDALCPEQWSDWRSSARAIIAAYQAKLRQGVELPEVDMGNYSWNLRYTQDQLQQYGDARDQAGYLRGLEDAKGVCHDLGLLQEISQAADVCWECAAAIEQLKVK